VAIERDLSEEAFNRMWSGWPGEQVDTGASHLHGDLESVWIYEMALSLVEGIREPQSGNLERAINGSAEVCRVCLAVVSREVVNAVGGDEASDARLGGASP
jgi:hypothetical protein